MRRIIGSEADRAAHRRGAPIVSGVRVRRYRVQPWSQRIAAAIIWIVSLYTGNRKP